MIKTIAIALSAMMLVSGQAGAVESNTTGSGAGPIKSDPTHSNSGSSKLSDGANGVSGPPYGSPSNQNPERTVGPTGHTGMDDSNPRPTTQQSGGSPSGH
jgi:hypothetical protein